MDDKSIHAPQEPPSPQGARSADVSLVGAKAWWLGALAPVLLGLISISAVVTPWEHVAVLCRVFGAVSLLGTIVSWTVLWVSVRTPEQPGSPRRDWQQAWAVAGGLFVTLGAMLIVGGHPVMAIPIFAVFLMLGQAIDVWIFLWMSISLMVAAALTVGFYQLTKNTALLYTAVVSLSWAALFVVIQLSLTLFMPIMLIMYVLAFIVFGLVRGGGFWLIRRHQQKLLARHLA